jgi:hypothetical protein
LKHQEQQEKFYKEFCDKVVSLDPAIRFAGIVDAEGKLLGISERKGLIPLLTPEERAQYAITAATRQFTRLRWEHHLGKIHYALCETYQGHNPYYRHGKPAMVRSNLNIRRAIR